LPITAAIGGELGGSVTPVLKSRSVHLKAAPAVLKRVQPKLPVLEVLESRVKAARVLDHFSAHKRRESDCVAEEEPIRVIRRESELPLPVAEELHATISETDARISLERRPQGHQRSGSETVVRVENDRVRRLYARQACVARIADSAAFSGQKLNLRWKPFEDIKGDWVGRSVVHHDDEWRASLLLKHALNCLRQEATVVEARDDHGDVTVAC
jgi:hypothetical protein